MIHFLTKFLRLNDVFAWLGRSSGKEGTRSMGKIKLRDLQGNASNDLLLKLAHLKQAGLVEVRGQGNQKIVVRATPLQQIGTKLVKKPS